MSKQTSPASDPGADQRFAAPPHVVATRARGSDLVLLNVERGRYYTLNDVGSRIWSMVCEGRSFADIVDHVCAEYDVPRGRAEGDAGALIRRLLSESLVRCDP